MQVVNGCIKCGSDMEEDIATNRKIACAAACVPFLIFAVIMILMITVVMPSGNDY